MFRPLLEALGSGQAASGADIRQTLGLNRAMYDSLVLQLERLGYVTTVPTDPADKPGCQSAGCPSSSCAGCPVSHVPMGAGSQQLIMTERGRAYLARRQPGTRTSA